MDNQLQTLSKIFTERLFRIPDYQRGYAWTEKQLKDFWNDIQQLDVGHNHYTGVLTLESVPKKTIEKWDDDRWIIEAKNYQPYFVVDGQQRLTTSIILVQVLVERLGDSDKLNFTDKIDIQRKFIFDSKDAGISRSYVFGYERDNPSYEFLKTRIFCEKSSSDVSEETVYTQNLERAKIFFKEQVDQMPASELEVLYRKVTQQLLFNIFTITEEVDVCVAFETMNNRGKPLSYLELLKNRLIYLSIKMDEDEYEKASLRRAINDCWKAVYHKLGKNKEQLLDDDSFLYVHYLTYFGKSLLDGMDSDDHRRYRKLMRMNYADDLLENRFVSKNISSSIPWDTRITTSSIYEYVSSLQESIETWYNMANPGDSDYGSGTKLWLDKINRLGGQVYSPLILAFLQAVPSEKQRVAFLRTLERHLFVWGLVMRGYGPSLYSEVSPRAVEWAIEITTEKGSADKVTKALDDATNRSIRENRFVIDAMSRFRSDGYYDWPIIRYFLYEYNLDIQDRSKTDRPKIQWQEFAESPTDYVTVEHIFPRRARDQYWTSRFGRYPVKQRAVLRDSLGNLLPLSRPKNSSLSNRPFPEKVLGRNEPAVGYQFGSYAENEVALEPEWNPERILKRGIRMLEFMERRWGLDLGDEDKKIWMLGLDFMKK